MPPKPDNTPKRGKGSVAETVAVGKSLIRDIAVGIDAPDFLGNNVSCVVDPAALVHSPDFGPDRKCGDIA